MNLHELDRLHDSATKGEWKFRKVEHTMERTGYEIRSESGAAMMDDQPYENLALLEADAALIVALVNAYPEIRKHILAAEKLAEAAERMGREITHHDPVQWKAWDAQRNAALASYREALK